MIEKCITVTQTMKYMREQRLSCREMSALLAMTEHQMRHLTNEAKRLQHNNSVYVRILGDVKRHVPQEIAAQIEAETGEFEIPF